MLAYCTAIASEDRESMRDSMIAARAAAADQKSFKQALKELS
jgi:hypothetical protein